MHRNSPENGTAAAVCSYRRFDNVSIVGARVAFDSVGSCVALTSNGTRVSFISDNRFAIHDGGQPGPGVDAIDVNFVGASGVAVPGGFLVEGNFVVGP